GDRLRPALEPAGASVPRLERFARPGLVSVADVTGPAAPLAGLAPLFHDSATCQLAHVPVGTEGVLVLTERRDDRIFEADDWDMLRAIVLQGEMSLRRLRLMESVRALSLTDPLTGLANRRHLEVVLRHAWAAAQRGEPLSVMILDLDGFKAINDGLGHQTGDHVLRLFASSLLQEARGSDVAVRYGGDEFLVVLPGGRAPGARALARRVRERMAGCVDFSEGVAEYWSDCASPEELIRAADLSLYQAKTRRAREVAAPAPTVPGAA
ncbi:MAG TPA: GGDEF domain-containing protein, partial [Longimicrobiaceae bacterium]|nr:GGDEF domain-containing protein [Longimicrobiaceae bacterium]